jgi:hypothetical protein
MQPLTKTWSYDLSGGGTSFYLAQQPLTLNFGPTRNGGIHHHIHDKKVGDEPLLSTPAQEDETFAILCFENYYWQWEKDFKIKAKQPAPQKEAR